MASRNETGDSGTKAGPPAFISAERIPSWTPIGSSSEPTNGFPSTLASRSRRRLGRRRQEDRLLEGHRHVALLEHDPVARDVGLLRDLRRDVLRGQPGIQPGFREAGSDQRHHRAHSVRVRGPGLRHQARHIGRRRRERVDALPADVHAARVAGVVDARAGVGQVVEHADELDAEQREDAGRPGGIREPGVDPRVVEVGRAEDPDPFRGRGLDGVLGALEGREVGRDVDVRVDDGSPLVGWAARAPAPTFAHRRPASPSPNLEGS